MTREAFFKEIAKRTEVDLDTVKKIGEEYEQLVFEGNTMYMCTY